MPLAFDYKQQKLYRFGQIATEQHIVCPTINRNNKMWTICLPKQVQKCQMTRNLVKVILLCFVTLRRRKS